MNKSSSSKPSLIKVFRVAVLFFAIASLITTAMGFYITLLPGQAMMAFLLSAAVQGSLMALNFLLPQVWYKKNTSGRKLYKAGLIIILLFPCAICWIISAGFSYVFYVNIAYQASRESDVETMLASTYLEESKTLMSEIQAKTEDARKTAIDTLVALYDDNATATVSTLTVNGLEWSEYWTAELDRFSDSTEGSGWDAELMARSRFNPEEKQSLYNNPEAVEAAYISSLGSEYMRLAIKAATLLDPNIIQEDSLNAAIEAVEKQQSVIENLKIDDTNITNLDLNDAPANSITQFRILRNGATKKGEDDWKTAVNQWKVKYYDTFIPKVDSHYDELSDDLEEYIRILESIKDSARYQEGLLMNQLTNIQNYRVSDEIDENDDSKDNKYSASTIYQKIQAALIDELSTSNNVSNNMKLLGEQITTLNYLIEARNLIDNALSNDMIYYVYYDLKTDNVSGSVGSAAQSVGKQSRGETDFNQAWSNAINDLLKANSLVTQSAYVSGEQQANASEISSDSAADTFQNDSLVDEMERLKHTYLADINDIQGAMDYLDPETNAYPAIARICIVLAFAIDPMGLLLGFILYRKKKQLAETDYS